MQDSREMFVFLALLIYGSLKVYYISGVSDFCRELKRNKDDNSFEEILTHKQSFP